MPSLRKKPSGGPPSPVPLLAEASIDEVLGLLKRNGRTVDEQLLRRVYAFSSEMHHNQVRRSGEPFLTHPLHVAQLLATLRFDETCVAVGLLHDVLEDTLTNKAALAEQFGEEIAELVDGVTKIGRHAYVRRDEAQADTFRKLILASVKDIRVIVVKLADRLHNMMTLQHMSPEARRRISQETLEIYAPLAHRLGMAKVQGDLEDLAFYHLYQHQYAALHDKIEEKVKLDHDATKLVDEQLSKSLEEAGIKADTSFRVKRFYSIYSKMNRQGIDVAQLYDYHAFRVITSSVRDCYAALGVVHQNWRPVPGRFKDYIAMPKPNLYQSLQTTVVGEGGQPFEVQIRTLEMDLIAEEGIAAHWRYKQGDDPSADDRNIIWLRQLLESQQDVRDARTFLTALKVELYPDEVYAFTPKGDVYSFPRGATPLDFAYRIHTELGHHCVGARVNGKLVPLRSEFQNGDIVEIVANANRNPSRDWLSFVRTSRAKSKIRQWLNTEQNKRSREIGRRLLEKALKKHKTSPKKVFGSESMQKLLTSEGMSGVDDLFVRIGFGKMSVAQVLTRILSNEQLSAAAEEPSRIRRAVNKILPFGGGGAITVKGHSDMLAYLAKCCSPVPGEEIVGFITRGRGVSVHSTECSNVENLFYNPEREIEVDWAKSADDVFPIVLVLETEDHPGILARMTEAIAKLESNIRQIEADTSETGRGLIDVVVEVRNQKHIDKLRQALQALPGVLSVTRRRGSRRKSGEVTN